jgi:hypothetical protein
LGDLPSTSANDQVKEEGRPPTKLKPENLVGINVSHPCRIHKPAPGTRRLEIANTLAGFTIVPRRATRIARLKPKETQTLKKRTHGMKRFEA